jgi:hypothetical protein
MDQIERTEKAIDAILAEFIPKLMEHCDAVQVMLTFPSPDGKTRGKVNGRGNWYARKGMAHEFISRDQACEIANAIAETQD